MRPMRWLPLLLLSALSLGYFSQTLDRTLNLHDEGYLLQMASRVAHGEVPHRDFVELYGPGVLSASGLALALGDGRILAVRWLLAAFKTAAVLLVFLISRRFLSRRVAWLGGLLAIAFWGRASINLNTPYASLYTIPICLLSLELLLRAHERSRAGSYLLAGIAAGGALLFKQSVGAMNTYALALAICALALLGLDRRISSRAVTGRATIASTLVLWIGAALLPLWPAASFLRSRDYVLHFLPLHLAMAGVAIVVVRSRRLPDFGELLRLRLLPYGLGAALLPGLVAAFYAASGALPQLVYDMFDFPMSLQNYFLPAGIPPLGSSVFMIGALALLAAAVLGVGRGGRLPWALAAVALATIAIEHFLAAASKGEAARMTSLWPSAFLFDWVQSSVTIVASCAILVRPLVASGNRTISKTDSRTLRIGLSLVFFQALLCFQIFPRAGQNVWLVMGAYTPLLLFLLDRVHAKATRHAGAVRKRAAGILLALLPLWLAVPVVSPVLWPGDPEANRRPLQLAHTQGITISNRDFQLNRIDALQKLLVRIAQERPSDAPLLLFGNTQMIYFMSGRRHLDPRREFLFFSAASGMLPLTELAGLADGRLLRKLRRHPDTIVVVERDPSGAHLRAALPDVYRFVQSHFDVAVAMGPYRLLRRRGLAASK